MFVWQVILDLEEERQRHAQDTAEGDDVTYMLEKERERLTQQVQPVATGARSHLSVKRISGSCCSVRLPQLLSFQ